jgi:V/A-type H+/Na+-transporting ATPase subunit I
VLKPAPMQRVAIVGLRDQRSKVTALLYDLGVLQIEPLSKPALTVLKAETDVTSSREVSEELLRIRSLMAALPPTPFSGKRGFASQEELMAASKSINIDQEVSHLKQQEERLNSRLDELRSRTELVHGLEFINADLSVLDLESATSFFGTLSADAFAGFSKNISQLPDVMLYSSGTDPVRVVAVVPRKFLEDFGSIIQKGDVRLQRIPPMKGTASQVLAGLESERTQDEAELQNIHTQLHSLSETYYGIISTVEEQLSIEARKLEILNNIGFTDTSFALEGWAPRSKLSSLKDAIGKFSPSTNLFDLEAEPEDVPPTLLENPKRIRFFESFIRFYSLPESNEFDPTFFFALTFPIFFGLMLGDVGYSIVILGVAIWILRRLKKPGGRTIIPGALRRFAKNIFKPVQYGKLARAMIPGAIIGIFFGFVFNEYFGFHFNQYLFSYLNTSGHLNLPSYLTSSGAFLDPISSRGLKTLLLVSGYVGLFEVSLGLVLGMIAKHWAGETRHIFGKIGWLSVGWGIALLGLILLHHGSVDPATNILAGVYIVLVVAGVGLIAYGEGTLALIELPSIISHILSYTRLLGILLASVALALVVNSQFEGLAGPLFGVGTAASTVEAVGFAIAGVVILVFGQLFNIILAMFEPGIQGARLIYVEFFSKFYHGGGRYFLPFKGRRTHTVSELEMMESAK